MKQSKLYIIPLLFFLGILIGLGCKHDHSHKGDDHAGHHHNEDENTHTELEDHHERLNKEVHLNLAQFENAGIKTGDFEMKNLSDVVKVNGYTKLDPQDEADVSMPVSGTIKKINVIEGNYIKKGHTLAVMTSLEYNRMLHEEADLIERLSLVEQELPYLKSEYERQEALSKDNINARKVFEKVSADLNIAESKIKNINAQLAIVNQAINMVSNAKGSTISIKAPISGFVTHLDAKIGTVVQPGKPLFTIVDNSKMHVDLLIYEKDLSKVKVGQTVRFILTNQSNQEIKGTIYNIGKSFANDTKSVAVHADIAENNANLIPGMYINALIDIGTNTVRTLPEEAIVRAEGRNFIFIQLEHDKESNDNDHDEIEFMRIEVSTGASQLGFVEVTPLEKIPEQGEIVTHGTYYIQSHLQKSEGGGGHSH